MLSNTIRPIANAEMSWALKITMTKSNSNEPMDNLSLDSQLLRTDVSELQSLSSGVGDRGETVQCGKGAVAWELGAWTLQLTLCIPSLNPDSLIC